MTKNKEKFIQLLHDHKQIIFKVCNMYCKDSEDQKDLVQDVIYQLWNSFENYDSKYKVTTWMYRIALNVAISFYRKTKTKMKYNTRLDDSFLEIGVEEEIDQAEEVKMLKNFINQLDKMNKALMILYLDGNSHEEIGNVLNISTSNVGTKINRIKSKLKDHFKKLNYYESNR
ncbi:MAG: sigma-70 family RNA polymerase sigma factor [Fulvivirga sp.]|nr:sigma-70 family RNA polymerase sigma factor [Fulvivirga sp.]